MSAQENIFVGDVLVKILSFLDASDIWNLSSTSKVLVCFALDENFWRNHCEIRSSSNQDEIIQFHRLKSSILNHSFSSLSLSSSSSSSSSSSMKYSAIAREMQALHSMKTVSLRKISNFNRRGEMSMEGHAASVLLNRFMILVGGWGNHAENNVYCYDALSLSSSSVASSPGVVSPSLTSVPSVTHGNPRFKYGFTVVPASTSITTSNTTSNTASSKDRCRLLVFGGCASGGYTNDVNGTFHFTSLHFTSSHFKPCLIFPFFHIFPLAFVAV